MSENAEPLRVSPPSIPTGSDDQARKESEEVSAATLKRQSHVNDARRGEDLKRHVHRATLCLFWVAVVSLASMIIVYVVHFLMPDSWSWVSVERLEMIKAVLVGAGASSVMTSYARKLLGGDDKPKSKDDEGSSD